MSDITEIEAQNWRAESDQDGIVWLCLDKADGSANVLSEAVLREFESFLSSMENASPRGLVIHSGKAGGFVMGADINEFTRIESSDQAFNLIRLGQRLFDRLEGLSCPSVAVINGFALGGGLELALACRYRVALKSNKPVIGLPEIQLGLHPGFGGTIRSVRVAGVRAAMQLMLTGKPIRVDKALAQGYIDHIVTEDSWRQLARELIASGRPARRAPMTERLLGLPLIRPLVARMLRKQVAAKARPDHYPAPYALIELWQRHGASRESTEAEARSFAELMVGSTSRNLVRIFFLQNRLKSQGGDAKPEVRHVHVVGAGVMGGDIAAWCALRGLEVTLQDRAEEYVQPAMQRAARLFSRQIPDANDRAAATDRLRVDVAGDGVVAADLIIEAIFEKLDAKQALYRELQARMKTDAILATNTSSLRLEDLRTVLDRPDRFIGLHFFNPVAKLPLVEVVRCDDTARQALDVGYAFARNIGKFPLGCISAPGFVVNRVLGPYMGEALYLAEEGISRDDIDRAAVDFGMPMGPLELMDSVGLDVALHVSRVLGAAFGRRVPDTLAAMVDLGKLGRKSGQGFYEWKDGRAVRSEQGNVSVSSRITDRLMLPLVNESVACLSEGIVDDGDLLDAGVIFGTGFAPFRGGPLQYARDRGIDDVVAALNALAREFADRGGDRFAPHPGWDRFRSG